MADTVSAPHERSDSERHKDKESTSWIIGAVLIVLGLAFFLQNAGLVSLAGNWWAIFIYLAAGGSFANAWRSYRAVGGFGKSGTGSLIWGLVLTVVATIFAFGLLWDVWWPAILIAIGIGIVIGHIFQPGG